MFEIFFFYVTRHFYRRVDSWEEKDFAEWNRTRQEGDVQRNWTHNVQKSTVQLLEYNGQFLYNFLTLTRELSEV
jgi:hypothetical protein